MSYLIKSSIALILSVVVVHLAYIGVIRPEADLIIETAKAAGQSSPRHFYVIIKDYEQEICIILMVWSSFLIIDKCISILKHRFLFKVDLLEAHDDKNSNLDEALTELDKLPQEIIDTPLVQALMSSIRRFLITGDVHNTSEAIESSIESMALKQEAENSMVRYLIWVVPSIGFIGTVRGIGQALSQADKALAGDIAGMTDSLGVAFNSTFIALLISILLMFLLHQLQRLQDGLLIDTQSYCEKFLLNRISRQKQID